MIPIGVRLPARFISAGEFLADAQALEAAGVDLLLVGEGELDDRQLLAALAAATTRVGLYSPEGDATLAALARGRLSESLEGWREQSFPASRAAWRDALAEQEAKGAVGVILDHDARILDLLRNPDREDERSIDLQLAQG